jgi:hypothetical protein
MNESWAGSPAATSPRPHFRGITVNRKLMIVTGVMVAMCGAFVPAQTVTPTLANTKLRPPLSPFDAVPPAVVSITSQSGAAGTPANPIPAADPLVVTFSKTVSLASLDPVSNFIVRNQNVVNASYPAGVLVPGFITPFTPGATNDSVYVFTPFVPYGPGVSPTQGYDIEVRIGSFGSTTVPPILGLPQGPSAIQLPLSNSLNRVFRTTPCTGCSTPAAIAETFDTTNQRDLTFVQTFGQQARWNAPSAPGKLAGRLTAGSSTGTTPASLGTRVQITVDPQPPTTTPAGLYAPFDASAASSGGQCGPAGCNLGINPNGGSHIMHLYESIDLLSIEDSLEQIEWSPVNSLVIPTTYPGYRIWCGLTNIQAPMSGPLTAPGLNSSYDLNYNLTPYQTGVLIGACGLPAARKVACGGPIPYTTVLQTTHFYPFPTLNPCFDFSTSSGSSGAGVNLLVEQDIASGNQLPNFNRFRATAFNPVRRLIDRPLAQYPPGVCAFNAGGTFDIYRMRFTFVGIVGQARSLWYDTGTANPTYIALAVSPQLMAQPAGTQSTWILEGTDTLNPGPAATGPSGVYIHAGGNVFPSVLTSTIAQLRYFRYRVELRGNNVTNATPTYDSVLMAYHF